MPILKFINWRIILKPERHQNFQICDDKFESWCKMSRSIFIISPFTQRRIENCKFLSVVHQNSRIFPNNRELAPELPNFFNSPSMNIKISLFTSNIKISLLFLNLILKFKINFIKCNLLKLKIYNNLLNLLKIFNKIFISLLNWSG